MLGLQRDTLDDALACLAGADDHQRVALMRLVQTARTENEKSVINEIMDARVEVAKAKRYI